MAQAVGDGERAARADGVHEQRLRAVERVDVAGAVLDALPAGGLHGAADLERQLRDVAPGLLDAALAHEPQQGAVGADVVEAVVVHADVADVRGHEPLGLPPAEVQEAPLAGGVELQQGRADLEALGPLRPAPGRVPPVDGEHG